VSQKGTKGGGGGRSEVVVSGLRGVKRSRIAVASKARGRQRIALAAPWLCLGSGLAKKST